jgi:hypothetical protein
MGKISLGRRIKSLVESFCRTLLFLQDYSLLSMEPWTATKKSKNLVWRCHQPLSGFLAKDYLPWVSRQSRRSLMIRLIMIWSWGLCTDLLAFALQLRKTSARRPSDEGTVRQVIASNGVSFLQMRSIGWHSTSGREKGGIKERSYAMIGQTLPTCSEYHRITTCQADDDILLLHISTVKVRCNAT